MSIIIFNKKLISAENPCVYHNDRGFTLGHGLFETILIKKKLIPMIDYHWNRLIASAPMLGIEIPFSQQELESMVYELIVDNKLQDKMASARVTITHGESERGILPLQAPKPNFLISVSECARLINRPYSAVIVKTRKNEQSVSSRIKSISYLDNILARQEAMSKQYDEAILLNTASNLADGAIANVYIVKNEEIFTPPIADGALPGVVRRVLLEEFSANFSITERSLSVDDMLDADELFLTNALMGVKPVNRLNTKVYHSFMMTNRIADALRVEKNYI
jgi:branched-chain amino acid aminotransferase